MAQTKSRFFSVMCVGEKPTEIMEKYNMNTKVEPYVMYKYLEAEKYLKTTISVQTKLIDNFDKIGLGNNIKEVIQERIKILKQMTPFEYYRELTDGMYYDTNGNALSDKNPDGKWVTCKIGKNFSIPLKTDNGDVYSALVKDIHWDEMHLVNKEVYESAWDICVDGKEPQTETEKSIFKSMGDKIGYFSNFKTKEDYVNYSTSYWNYAYVDEKGWVDINSEQNEKEWINKFYDRFIKVLLPNDKVTIFECTINSD